jgi:hypothetical protein
MVITRPSPGSVDFLLRLASKSAAHRTEQIVASSC